MWKSVNKTLLVITRWNVCQRQSYGDLCRCRIDASYNNFKRVIYPLPPYQTTKIDGSHPVSMTEEDPYSKGRKRRDSESQSDAQGNNKPLDMEGEEENETSMTVDEDTREPDKANEEVDEKID